MKLILIGIAIGMVIDWVLDWLLSQVKHIKIQIKGR